MTASPHYATRENQSTSLGAVLHQLSRARGTLKQPKQQGPGAVPSGALLPHAPRFSLVPRAARMPTGLHNPEGHSLSSASLLEQEQTGFSIVLWLLAASHERQVTASLKNEWLLVSGMCHFGSNLVM